MVVDIEPESPVEFVVEVVPVVVVLTVEVVALVTVRVASVPVDEVSLEIEETPVAVLVATTPVAVDRLV
jgi:hypothetical protein